MKKIQRYLPAVIAAAFAAVMLAGYLFIFFFPNNTGTVLEDIDGKADTALKGFALKGFVYDASWHRSFSLENGEVTNGAFKPYALENKYERSYINTQWGVAPSARSEVNANAKFILQNDGTELSTEEAKNVPLHDGYYRSQCSAFVLMASIYNEKGEAAIFQVGDEVKSEEPIEVQSYYIYDASAKQEIIGDFQIYSTTQATEKFQTPRLGEFFVLNGVYYAVCDTGTNNIELYKITEFSNVEYTANGELLGKKASLKTEPIGKAEKLCTFSGEKSLKSGTAGGSIYLQSYSNGNVITRLLDENGVSQSTKNIDVSKYSDVTADSVGKAYTSASDKESDGSSFATAVSISTDGTHLLTGFQAKNGKLVKSCTAIYTPEYDSMTPNYVTLSSDGSRLLVTALNYNEDAKRENGAMLMAYENDSDIPYYKGWLDVGQMNDLQPGDLGYKNNGTYSNRNYIFGNNISSGYIYINY